MAIVKAAHLRRQPRRHVHAVGHVADGHRVFRAVGIQASPHGARNFAVQRANRIHAPRQLQAQHRHAEGLAVVRGMLAAKAHQVFVRDAQLLAQRPQVLLDQVGAEAVVTRGHRRVRGKDHLARNLPRGRVEIQAFLFHASANRLEDREAAVAFVQVQNAGRNAHGLERAKTAHAQQQLLPDARARVAAVKPRGGFQILRRIARHIRVQQQKIAAAHLHAPHLGANRAAARSNLHHHRLAVGADGRLHGQLIHIVCQILLALPTAFVEPLQKVALPVEKADADQRNVQVRCALDVVAGQHAQAAGVNRQRLVQPELGGEIGHRPRPQHARMAAPQVRSAFRYSCWRR